MRYALCLSFLMVLLISCMREDPDQPEAIGEVTIDTLTVARSVDVGAELNALGLFATESRLIVLNRGPDQLFALFSLPTLEPLYTWGTQGEGPGEFSAPVAAASLNVFGDKLEVDDANRQVLRTFEIGEESLSLVDERALPYDGQRGPLNTVTRLDSLTYVATVPPAGEEVRPFLLLNLDTEATRPFGAYPPTELTGREKYASYMKRLVASPDGRAFYTMYLNHDRVRLYSADGTLLEEQRAAGLQETTGVHRMAGSATERFAYMLAPFAEEEEMLGANGYQPVLEVWDWSGSLVAAYVLAEPVHFVAVSSDDAYVYGYSYLTPEELFVFELP